jgi:hypothetical protein
MSRFLREEPEKQFNIMKSLNKIMIIRRQDLASVLGFLNAQMDSMGEEELSNLIRDLASGQGPNTVEPPILNFWEAYRRLAGPMFSSSSPEALGETKRFLGALQGHLKAKIEGIMQAGASGEVKTIFEGRGKRRIAADPEKGRFVETFVKDQKSEEPLALEKQYLDERLINLIRELELDPGRFKRCSRCNGVFYQSSPRERKYCSRQCAGAIHQAHFRERKKITLPPTADTGDSGDVEELQK